MFSGTIGVKLKRFKSKSLYVLKYRIVSDCHIAFNFENTSFWFKIHFWNKSFHACQSFMSSEEKSTHFPLAALNKTALMTGDLRNP